MSAIQQTNLLSGVCFMRFAVLSKGVLRGMGREAVCELLATKTVLPEASRAVYSHCAIIEAPSDLPDGDYEVEFAGEVAVTSLRDGSWMVGRLLPHTYSEAQIFYAQESTASRAQADTRRAGPPSRRSVTPGDAGGS
jgi:hypothetical protein